MHCTSNLGTVIQVGWCRRLTLKSLSDLMVTHELRAAGTGPAGQAKTRPLFLTIQCGNGHLFR